MTFTASDVIAVVAILAGIATTGIVSWIAHLDRRTDREHERKLALEAHEHEAALARDSRLQDRRAKAYRDMLALAFRIQYAVIQTRPMLVVNPPPTPVAQPTPEEQREMGATVAAVGSGEVVDCYRAFIREVQAFGRTVWMLDVLQPDASMPPIGLAEELKKAHNELETARRTVSDAVERLEQTARDELAA